MYQTLVDNALSSLSNAYETYLNNFNTAPSLVASISNAAHFASVFLLYAKATSHTSPNIEHAESKWFFMCVYVSLSLSVAVSVCLCHCLCPGLVPVPSLDTKIQWSSQLHIRCRSTVINQTKLHNFLSAEPILSFFSAYRLLLLNYVKEKYIK